MASEPLPHVPLSPPEHSTESRSPLTQRPSPTKESPPRSQRPINVEPTESKPDPKPPNSEPKSTERDASGNQGRLLHETREDTPESDMDPVNSDQPVLEPIHPEKPNIPKDDGTPTPNINPDSRPENTADDNPPNHIDDFPSPITNEVGIPEMEDEHKTGWMVEGMKDSNESLSTMILENGTELSSSNNSPRLLDINERSLVELSFDESKQPTSEVHTHIELIQEEHSTSYSDNDSFPVVQEITTILLTLDATQTEFDTETEDLIEQS